MHGKHKTARNSRLTNEVLDFYYHAEVGATQIACA